MVMIASIAEPTIPPSRARLSSGSLLGLLSRGDVPENASENPPLRELHFAH
jgi:hypothetical protein